MLRARSCGTGRFTIGGARLQTRSAPARVLIAHSTCLNRPQCTGGVLALLRREARIERMGNAFESVDGAFSRGADLAQGNDSGTSNLGTPLQSLDEGRHCSGIRNPAPPKCLDHRQLSGSRAPYPIEQNSSYVVGQGPQTSKRVPCYPGRTSIGISRPIRVGLDLAEQLRTRLRI